MGGKLHCLILTYADGWHYTTEKLSLVDFFCIGTPLPPLCDGDYGGQVGAESVGRASRLSFQFHLLTGETRPTLCNRDTQGRPFVQFCTGQQTENRNMVCEETEIG